MSKEFEAGIIMRGSDDATPAQLEAALQFLLAKARRFPPDHRFNWNDVSLSVERYTENKG